ncbi:MAG TPA: DNA cytosine methyltransferase [Nitrososphaeraceae archaeon]|jgi:site-specific DNA-cytosine methylase
MVDIFCGCGGLSEGFRQAGFEGLLGIDCDKHVIKTYNRHHHNLGRIRKVEDLDSDCIFKETGRKEIDVLTGGPPCQAFSTVSVAKWRSLGIPVTLRHPLNRLYYFTYDLTNLFAAEGAYLDAAGDVHKVLPYPLI